MDNRNLIIFILPFVFILSCATSYVVILKNTETYFYRGNYETAADEIRPLVMESGEKDRLLYLMEAGLILHTMGEYKKSIKVFKQADYIAETIKTSITKQGLSFFLSDRESNFKGENFERVLIKFYIALNYIMLEDYKRAKQYFKKLDYDLKIMKYTEGKYKQNLAARYLDAIISENLKRYNDARVQYKNIMMIDPDNKRILGDRYILALKEQDEEDIRKYRRGSGWVLAYNNELEPVSYNTNMGELIIIHQAGKSAIKKSRGRLLDDKEFAVALRAAIEIALRTEGAAISTSAVIAMMGNAENPIPIYVKREPELALPVNVFLNNNLIGRTIIMNDYSETAIKNFNENYSKYIAKNVASIATKIVLAAIAANEISKRAEKATGDSFLMKKVGRFLIGAGTGSAVAATVKPDLRCWRLLPSNFQILRIFLEPGEYRFNIEFLHNKNVIVSNIPEKIKIEKHKLTFINFRSH